MTQRQQHLLGTQRWQWLEEALRLWYAEPLTTADGSTSEQIAAAEERVGPLPLALREWFELVGARVGPALPESSIIPATPDGVYANPGTLLNLWYDDQGAWRVSSQRPPDGCWDDDPVCDEGFGLEDEEPYASLPLSVMFHRLVLSETLDGAVPPAPWYERSGPFGQLGEQVHSGRLEDAADRHVLDAYPALPFTGLLRGDTTTVLQDEGRAIRWMIASDEAFALFNSYVDLDPPGGEQILTLRVTPHTAPPADPCEYWSDLVRDALGTLGRSRVGEFGPRCVLDSISTHSPDAVAAALLAAIPVDADVEITSRPARLSTQAPSVLAVRSRQL